MYVNAKWMRSFFMLKFKHEEEIPMFNDKILERIFSNEEMQKIPIGCQSTAVHVFQTILEELKEENPYATLSELLSESDASVSEL